MSETLWITKHSQTQYTTKTNVKRCEFSHTKARKIPLKHYITNSENSCVYVYTNTIKLNENDKLASLAEISEIERENRISVLLPFTKVSLMQ